MCFLVRSVEADDHLALYRLAQQTSSFHLPPDKACLKQMIRKSLQSFQDNIPPQDAVYLFIIEDIKKQKIIGTSQIIARYASEDHPYYYFQVSEKEYVDLELKISMNQPFLKLKKTTQELSAMGGVVVDADYRSLPEKLGKQIIMTRFVYMGMFKQRFGPKILSELMAPVTKEGVNLFWENLGARFTGLSLNQALLLLRQGKTDFIENLFPKENIYLSLLDQIIVPSLNRIERKYGEKAQHIIESLGFSYLDKVDIEGSLIYGAQLDHIHLVRKIKQYKIKRTESSTMPLTKYMGVMKNGSFRGGKYPCRIEKKHVCLPEPVADLMGLKNEDTIHLSPADLEK